MLVKYHAQGKFYLIACPEGSRITRRSERIDRCGGFLPDLILVPFRGKEIPVPADPAEHAAQSSREWQDVLETHAKRR